MKIILNLATIVIMQEIMKYIQKHMHRHLVNEKFIILNYHGCFLLIT